MKVLRLVTAISFVVTLCIFFVFYVVTKNNTDTTIPTIKISGEEIEVKVNATDAELLKGVTAFDEKDGDITSSVVVESISKFIGDGLCTVTYAVADSDNNVAKNTRTIRYTDYTPPRFTMSYPLVFSLDDSVDVSSIVGATDSIDGDISDKVVVTATNFTDNTVGVFALSLQATNSKGDIIELELPVYVEDKSLLAPIIELNEYMIYIKKGEKPNFRTYISTVTANNSRLSNDEVKISTDFDSQTPGVYSVHYYASNSLGDTGHTILTVIVEE